MRIPDYSRPLTEEDHARYRDLMKPIDNVPGESIGMEQARKLFNAKQGEITGKERYQILKDYPEECQAVCEEWEARMPVPLEDYPGECKITKVIFRYLFAPPKRDINGKVIHDPFTTAAIKWNEFTKKITPTINTKPIVETAYNHPKKTLFATVVTISGLAVFFFAPEHLLQLPVPLS